MAKKRVHMIIKGIVQGVGFRYFTYRRANSIGVGGFVRNLPDGTVEVVAEGEESDLQNLIGECRRGPSGGRVDDMDVEWDEHRGQFTSFNVSF